MSAASQFEWRGFGDGKRALTQEPGVMERRPMLHHDDLWLEVTGAAGALIAD
jgi:hypothetical protein